MKAIKAVLTVMSIMLAMTGIPLAAAAEEENLGKAALTEDSTDYGGLLFDSSYVHTIDLQLSEEDWQDLLEHPVGKTEYKADITIDGETVKDVSLSTNENSSLFFAAKTKDGSRYSFKVTFDNNEKGRTWYGLHKLNLQNQMGDAAYMMDYLCYELFRKMGVPLPLSSYVRLTVNGEDQGLYLAVEEMDESYLERNQQTDEDKADASGVRISSMDGLPESGETSERPEEDPEVMLPANSYAQPSSHEVNGRQGVCCEGDYYWVSGSATLTKYDRDWNVICENTDPFKGYELEVNHIGDIDVYNNELYIGAEYFMDGEGKNIQIAVYDGDTLELKRTFPFEPESGQLECSGIAVDPDTGTVVMCSWVGEESGRHLYRYDLKTGKYLGKVHMQMPPQWLQGIAYYDGCFYMTADDGTADDDEPDHLYRTKLIDGATNCIVTLERTLDDVTRQGEIEGLTFDKKNGQLLVLYNRGARIVLGMPKGFYEGYDREISEVFAFDMEEK